VAGANITASDTIFSANGPPVTGGKLSHPFTWRFSDWMFVSVQDQAEAGGDVAGARSIAPIDMGAEQ
jgi:hypothetical protein